jgi:hypothetical protein
MADSGCRRRYCNLMRLVRDTGSGEWARAASSIGPSDPKSGEAAVTSADDDDGCASHLACAFLPAPSRASMHHRLRPAGLSARGVRWSRWARDAHDRMS